MKYQAIIFDLDGTLVDTLEDLADSVNQMLERLSLPTHPVDAYRMKVGNGNRMLVKRALGEGHQHLFDKAFEMQMAYYTEHFCDKTQPYPGIMEMLSKLKKRKLKIAVLSNKVDELTQKLVRHVFGNSVFDIVRGHLNEVPLKPDPASALALAAQMNVAPEQVAYLGDTAIDMQTARQAGMFAIGASWGFRDATELLENGGEVIIDHPQELPKLLAT